jgi:hypothetical protein
VRPTQYQASSGPTYTVLHCAPYPINYFALYLIVSGSTQPVFGCVISLSERTAWTSQSSNCSGPCGHHLVTHRHTRWVPVGEVWTPTGAPLHVASVGSHEYGSLLTPGALAAVRIRYPFLLLLASADLLHLRPISMTILPIARRLPTENWDWRRDVHTSRNKSSGAISFCPRPYPLQSVFKRYPRNLRCLLSPLCGWWMYIYNRSQRKLCSQEAVTQLHFTGVAVWFLEHKDQRR